ncbi:AfsR/SARP family transcriptional regulator [Streptomyces regalis]|uniref:Transcriptional regulator n=1 Tax=Streptomyces regalis TaxID=68262 RepID=A0A117MQQ4_9ACTN|nr:AfsR/SARP family transcriptional regulator [Streptomyces regalis]KUL30612.1 transcriptional regulator [Streptomyces regalis]
MRFNLLGHVHVITDAGRLIPLKSSKATQLLALLLLRRHEVVGAGVLIEELWADDPPRSAMTTLQTYVYHTRRLLAEHQVTYQERELLLTRPPGYFALIDDDELDVTIVERLIRTGSRLLEEDRPEEALASLNAGLDLWRGPALSTVPCGRVLESHIAHLEELRLFGVQLRIDANWRLGRIGPMIPELRSLVISHPLNETLHAKLMGALYRVGRRAEALASYRNLRQILSDELGVDPTPEIQRMHMEILNGDHVLA